MTSSNTVYRATVALIWALALWHSWVCRGLFVDGSAFLSQIVEREWFFDVDPPRLYAMIVAQIPVWTAILLGSTDLHLLAQLLSMGLFGLPTALYHLALHRAKGDPVLLAAVIAAIGVVFLTTSFFIVGEYNSAYALVILVAVLLVTVDRPRWGNALLLTAVAALAMRTYEVMIYLGPLMAVMILATLYRVPVRPVVPTVLYILSAGFFLFGMFVAINSVVRPHSEEHLEETYDTALNFWQNMQFDLALGAAMVVVVWALVKPLDLLKVRPYRWAALCLGLLALSPLLAATDTLIRPLAKSQYVARTVSGVVIAAIVVFIWVYASDAHRHFKALILLRTREGARRFLAFACLIPFAVVPSDALLTVTWSSYLDVLRETVRSRSGEIAFEDTALSQRPHILLVEHWALSSQSLAVRSKPGDGVVLPPRGFKDWVPFVPLEPPNMGRFVWRE